MKRAKGLFCALVLIIGMLATGGGTEAAAAEKASGRYEASLKANGKITFKLNDELADDWLEKITGLYLRRKPTEAGEPVTEKDLVAKEKYTVGATKIVMDSSLFPVKPEETAEYEITILSEGSEPATMDLKVTNFCPLSFTLRSFDRDGKLKKAKTYSYNELAALCKTEGYYSAGCVMHGLISFHVQGVLLEDLLKDSGFEFSKGMSLACRVTDAPIEIKATLTNEATPTGEIFQNPEKYWIKPRYTDNFKHTYEDLMERERYFVSAPWEDAAIGKILKDDGSAFSFKAREALASNPKYLKPVKPMIALKYTSLQYGSDASDIRSFKDDFYDLTANERAFRFVYGLALDDNPTVNVTAYDKEAKKYPVLETPENKGKIALEEGPDACGTAARQAMLVFGIDIFESGGTK